MNGSLTLGANNAIPGAAGAGGLTLTNGTLTAGTALIIPNAVTFNPNISIVTLAGSSMLFTGATVVLGTAAASNTTLTVTNATTIGTVTAATGIISNAGSLTKQGPAHWLSQAPTPTRV